MFVIDVKQNVGWRGCGVVSTGTSQQHGVEGSYIVSACCHTELSDGCITGIGQSSMSLKLLRLWALP